MVTLNDAVGWITYIYIYNIGLCIYYMDQYEFSLCMADLVTTLSSIVNACLTDFISMHAATIKVRIQLFMYS